MRGATSFSNCSHFPIIEGSRTPNPVTLPPGRARLCTKPDPTGSSASTKNDGYRPRQLPYRRNRRRGACDNHVRRLADQLRRVCFEQSWFVRGKTIVDPDLAVVVPPEMPERIRESRDARPRDWIAVRPRHQAADATNSLRLCAGSNRPCRGPG